MNKYDLVIEYINLEKNNPLGCGRLAPLILMFNEDKKIVKELLKDSDCKYKKNLLCFLDRGLDSIYNISYNEDHDLKTLSEKIFYVLQTFNELENKWEISE